MNFKNTKTVLENQLLKQNVFLISNKKYFLITFVPNVTNPQDSNSMQEIAKYSD